MNELLKNLVQLQTLEWDEASDAKSKALIAELRTKIPAQILGHYDRLMVRGKKGIVPVRGQTCTGCHMQVPMAVVMTLMKAEDVQLCDHCGRYLYLEGQTPAAAPEEPPAKAPKRGRRKCKPDPGQPDSPG